LQPSEVLHKKAILVERGSFRPVSLVNVDMLRSAREQFVARSGAGAGDVVELAEITMRNLMADGSIDYRDFLARADTLGAAGKIVLISNYFEYYRLAAYLGRQTTKKIGVTMGAGSLRELFDKTYYAHLEGGILESFGRLFKNDLKLYIYPYRDPVTGEVWTVRNLQVPTELRKLYGYLVDTGCIEQLEHFQEECLPIFSRDILKKIKDHDESWEAMVPHEVADLIKQRGFFGYRKREYLGRPLDGETPA
jgi:hypothetical protein